MSEKVTGSDYCTCELVASTSAGATTLLVTEPTEAFPTFDVDNTYFYLTIVDEASYAINANPPVQREIVKVTAYSTVSTGYSLTVVRGVGGTTGQIWAAGAICEIRPCAQWFQDLKGGDGSAWAITDGITTVTDVTSLFVDATGNASVLITDLGSNAAALTVGASGGSSGIQQSQEFTSSGTFTPASGVTAVWITMIGGGGAGGGSNATAARGGGGGGSGELVENFLVPVSGATTVTIGNGGTGSSASAGSDGGITSFGSYNARGGTGGTVGTASAGAGAGGAGGGANGGAGGAVGGPGSAGAIGTASSPVGFGGGGGGGGGSGTSANGGAGAGSTGLVTGGAGGTNGSSQAGGGGGAATPWGIGGAGGAGGSAGSAASSTNYGAGGGGGGGAAGSTAGGNGAKGYCLVTWVGS